MLFATGLDPDRSTIFCQSHVTAHAEAAWLLSAVTSYGQLGRMTQFKEKADRQEFVTAGLFTYPVLMAGDILLYQTDLVPIGDDQRQHLELARDVAQRFNHRYGETFKIPDGQFPEVGGRVMDLQEPTNKMSTTLSSEQGAVYMTDTPEAIRKKFKSAVTDSGREVQYDPETKPGVSNLLEIMSVATGEPIDALESRFDGSGYGALKEAVGESVVSLLTPIRKRFEELRDARADVRADGLCEGRGGPPVRSGPPARPLRPDYPAASWFAWVRMSLQSLRSFAPGIGWSLNSASNRSPLICVASASRAAPSFWIFARVPW
jgi:tryptophanyl-tRNA synthetase